MRYELSDYEWTAIKPMLPNKPRGVRRVTSGRDVRKVSTTEEAQQDAIVGQ
jgi:transposase